MIIYRITNNLNGMIYIGQTRKTVAERVKQHIYRQSKIGKAMTKYGTENLSIDVIDHADTQEELDSLERFWIAFYNSCENGYNTLMGGKPTKNEFKMISKFANSVPRKKHKQKKDNLNKRKQKVYEYLKYTVNGKRPKPQIDDIALYEVYAENFECRRFAPPTTKALTQNQKIYIKNILIEKLYGIENCIYKPPLWWEKNFRLW